jgi:hypothetical protein
MTTKTKLSIIEIYNFISVMLMYMIDESRKSGLLKNENCYFPQLLGLIESMYYPV